MIINSSLPLHKQLERDTNPSMLGAVSRGIGGIIAAPIHGMEQNGVQGLIEGTTFGVLGAFASPTATLLEFAQHTSKALRDVAKSGILEASRMRPPRRVCEDLPLTPYLLNEALGNLVLESIEGGVYGEEGQTFSCLLQPANERSEARERRKCVLVTKKHVMCVGTNAAYDFSVEWVYSLRDIIEHSREGCTATLTVLLPLQHGGSPGKIGLPICQKQITFVSETDSMEFEECLM